VQGAVVAYDAALKESLLGVSAELLAGPGPVSAEVAQAMASGVCKATGAQIGVATTGAAGPEPHGGKPPGTAFVAVCRGEAVLAVRELHIDGDRGVVTHAVVGAALALLADTLDSLAA
jgi:nicotinamide-nucleotide amidase